MCHGQFAQSDNSTTPGMIAPKFTRVPPRHLSEAFVTHTDRVERNYYRVSASRL